jgi:hypothetical protein
VSLQQSIEEALGMLVDDLQRARLTPVPSRFNLTTSTTKETPTMATATLPTSTMFGIELSKLEHFHATEAQAAIDEYASNATYLRREGITLAKYVEGYQKDHGNYEPMHHALSSALEKLQAAFGATANPSNPLASV